MNDRHTDNLVKDYTEKKEGKDHKVEMRFDLFRNSRRNSVKEPESGGAEVGEEGRARSRRRLQARFKGVDFIIRLRGPLERANRGSHMSGLMFFKDH